jgi:hypothetical protein
MKNYSLNYWCNLFISSSISLSLLLSMRIMYHIHFALYAALSVLSAIFILCKPVSHCCLGRLFAITTLSTFFLYFKVTLIQKQKNVKLKFISFIIIIHKFGVCTGVASPTPAVTQPPPYSLLNKPYVSETVKILPANFQGVK